LALTSCEDHEVSNIAGDLHEYELLLVTAQAEKRSVIKVEITVGGKWVNIRRADFHVNERLKSA